MKVLLIADIHSNRYALEAVVAAEGDADLVLCVGDIVDWGMDPVPVLEWLQSRDHVAVAGNHDAYVVSADSNAKRLLAGQAPEEGTYFIMPEPAGKESCFMTYTLNQLDEPHKAYLRSLPQTAVVEIDGYTYYLKHTQRMKHPDVVLEAMLGFDSQRLFESIWQETGRTDVPPEKRRIVFAHTHQCWMHLVRGGALFMNPGSISNRTLGPDTLEPGADYIVITDGVPQMKHVSYPTRELRRRIADAPFDREQIEIALQLHTPQQTER